MIVIIPCGGKKRDYPCPAGEMYIGGYHLACQRYALSRVDRERVFILSALYGLLGLDETITPYDLRMGKPGSVSLSTLREQVEALGIVNEKEVTALGGIEYVKMVRLLYLNVRLPLKGVGGIGKQLAWLKEHT